MCCVFTEIDRGAHPRLATYLFAVLLLDGRRTATARPFRFSFRSWDGIVLYLSGGRTLICIGTYMIASSVLHLDSCEVSQIWTVRSPVIQTSCSVTKPVKHRMHETGKTHARLRVQELK